MQGQPDGSSVRNILEVSLTEEVTGAREDVFEVVFNSVASEERKKLDSTASEDPSG